MIVEWVGNAMVFVMRTTASGVVIGVFLIIVMTTVVWAETAFK